MTCPTGRASRKKKYLPANLCVEPRPRVPSQDGSPGTDAIPVSASIRLDVDSPSIDFQKTIDEANLRDGDRQVRPPTWAGLCDADAGLRVSLETFNVRESQFATGEINAADTS